MSITKILVTSETASMSTKVMGFAIHIATKLHIDEIVLLHVLTPTPSQAYMTTGEVYMAPGVQAAQIDQERLETQRKKLQAEAERFSTPQLRITPKVDFGDNRTRLNSYMQKYGTDLVIAEGREERGFIENLFGNDTERMIAQTDYPMIIIKEDSEISDVRKIAVAIDVSEERHGGLESIRDFAAGLGATMHLVHVITDENTNADDAIEKMRELAQHYHFTNHALHVVNSSTLEHGLHSFIQKYNPDMIAVLTQGKGKLTRFFYGSATDDILKESDKPIFVSKIV
ncbi:MAG: universal stress protein [Bacteroidales bacterium]|jgi:nucleotide-binding universal stress UspA family protein|nr:universal stress protein [Bacteroidales bacterium]MDD3527846.1 universal stress protein [Bacteroidales bacterium]MDD4178333.1 universal stress protein [Bacteroidales bacterium]MDY0336035.1 universal stress protein [Bacteroidales bacterium]NCU35806.1 universal stress protein [Candidatus Falkowbacteria bacterium]